MSQRDEDVDDLKAAALAGTGLAVGVATGHPVVGAAAGVGAATVLTETPMRLARKATRTAAVVVEGAAGLVDDVFGGLFR